MIFLIQVLTLGAMRKVTNMVKKTVAADKPVARKGRTAGRKEAGEAVQASAGSVVMAAPGWDDIARRAYEIFEREGRPDGRHVEHWLRAEAELRTGA